MPTGQIWEPFDWLVKSPVGRAMLPYTNETYEGSVEDTVTYELRQ